jgi:O-antigen/teichoic acid export membrane protein
MKTVMEDAPAPAAFMRHQLPAPLATLLSILHSPLTRNGYALVMSAGITSVLGLLFWIIAARLYPADQVGVGAAMLAALLTLGNIAQLNLDTVLNRFLPIAGTRTKDMIAWSYAASVMTALVISLVFILATTLIAPKLSFLAESIWLALVFMISCAVWALFALQDAVLAGLRKSTWIPLENTAYSPSRRLERW